MMELFHLRFKILMEEGRLKQFIDTCHGNGLAVILDVVTNHFGPEGNFLLPICLASPINIKPLGESDHYE